VLPIALVGVAWVMVNVVAVLSGAYAMRFCARVMGVGVSGGISGSEFWVLVGERMGESYGAGDADRPDPSRMLRVAERGLRERGFAGVEPPDLMGLERPDFTGLERPDLMGLERPDATPPRCSFIPLASGRLLIPPVSALTTYCLKLDSSGEPSACSLLGRGRAKVPSELLGGEGVMARMVE